MYVCVKSLRIQSVRSFVRPLELFRARWEGGRWPVAVRACCALSRGFVDSTRLGTRGSFRLSRPGLARDAWRLCVYVSYGSPVRGMYVCMHVCFLALAALAARARARA